RRFQNSARRLVMPEMETELFVRAIDELLHVEKDWVPDKPNLSLYLRPIMFATDAVLALRPSTEYRFLLMAFVTEGFFNDDLSPVRVWVTTDSPGAAGGGAGAARAPGNCAGALAAQVRGVERGCDQVVWLDSVGRGGVEEWGGMTLFFVRQRGGQSVVTPPPL